MRWIWRSRIVQKSCRHDYNQRTIVATSWFANRRHHEALGSELGAAADNAVVILPQATACGVERREAQRFGGEASQTSRSPPARASGWVSQTYPCKARRVP